MDLVTFWPKAGIEGRTEEGINSRPLGTRLRLAMTELGSTYVKLGAGPQFATRYCSS